MHLFISIYLISIFLRNSFQKEYLDDYGVENGGNGPSNPLYLHNLHDDHENTKRILKKQEEKKEEELGDDKGNNAGGKKDDKGEKKDPPGNNLNEKDNQKKPDPNPNPPPPAQKITSTMYHFKIIEHLKNSAQ